MDIIGIRDVQRKQALKELEDDLSIIEAAIQEYEESLILLRGDARLVKQIISYQGQLEMNFETNIVRLI